MLRDILSYLVLILVPVVSLATAIVPYIIVKRRYADKRRPHVDISGQNEPIQRQSTASSDIEPIRPWISTPHLTAKLWLAFLIGLVGNVVWWWIADELSSDSVSIYLNGLEEAGIFFGFLLYSFFIIITPFIFYKIKHRHFTTKAVIYNIIISLITAGFVFGCWIVLAIIGWRQLFYQLN